MSYLASLPDDALLLDVFKAWPAMSRPLIEMHVAVMEDAASPFTVGERELTGTTDMP